ncbi:MAG: PAS domain S-box protein [Firmicutes bacterium]|jgi:PAS domain S-box-containing protein|nr:PAS domain S-box protein [Bacillota bacterium]
MALITTIRANCKDCYKCVRHCPMKAIRVVAGHAEVVEERCIGDGTCVRICPQGAKQVADSLQEAKAALTSARRAALSIAPSFVASLSLDDPRRLAGAARRLGFDTVAETAEAAYWVTLEHMRVSQDMPCPVISSSCPVIVNLVEKYYPDLISHLAPVASPMVAHGRMLRARHGRDIAVVFAGPCIAKKEEAARKDACEAVDAVLTFAELSKWFEEEGIDPSTEDPLDFDAEVPGRARLFPLEGGLAATAGLSTDVFFGGDLTVTGLDDCILVLDNLDAHRNSRIVELMACPGGCIGGPYIGSDVDVYTRREQVMAYYAGRWGELGPSASGASPGPARAPESVRDPGVCLAASFAPRTVGLPMPTEEQIREILAKTDKLAPEDELNCGACGYNSCREKAVAVFQGMAEVEMCMPYMRARAESMSNLIIRSTPNGIIVVDRDLSIVAVNPAFESMFGCTAEDVVGQPVDVVMDSSGFRQVFARMELVELEASYRDGALHTRQNIIYVDKRDVAVSIVTDVTREFQQRKAMQRAREDTLAKAGAVITRQMRVAQEIAGLLGETTAETKVLLTQLMKQMQNEELK